MQRAGLNAGPPSGILNSVAAHPAFSLESAFSELNLRHFEGMLDAPELAFNPRLRISAGRFIPGARTRGRFFRMLERPRIEIAHYLLTETNADHLIKDTLGHEMIHLWLWSMRRPYGHTTEFWSKMEEMGVSRYNPVPKRRPPKYLYACPSCEREFPARKRWRSVACARCCQEHAGGRYDSRFKLALRGANAAGVGVMLLIQSVMLLSLVTLSACDRAGPAGGGGASDSVWVSREDPTPQCDTGGSVDRRAQAEGLLKDASIPVLESKDGSDGQMRMQLCGSPSGKRFMFRIPTKDAGKAEAQGYRREP